MVWGCKHCSKWRKHVDKSAVEEGQSRRYQYQEVLLYWEEQGSAVVRPQPHTTTQRVSSSTHTDNELYTVVKTCTGRNSDTQGALLHSTNGVFKKDSYPHQTAVQNLARHRSIYQRQVWILTQSQSRQENWEPTAAESRDGGCHREKKNVPDLLTKTGLLKLTHVNLNQGENTNNCECLYTCFY